MKRIALAGLRGLLAVALCVTGAVGQTAVGPGVSLTAGMQVPASSLLFPAANLQPSGSGLPGRVAASAPAALLSPLAVALPSPALSPVLAPAPSAVRPVAASPLQALTRTGSVSRGFVRGTQEGGAWGIGSAFDGSRAPRAEVPAVDVGVVQGRSVPSGLSVPAEVGTEGVRTRWGGLRFEGKRLEFLGGGSFGKVYGHPRMRGAVIKLMSFSLALFSTGVTDLPQAVQDLEVGRRLAEAGVGPQVYGVTAIPGEAGFLRRALWRLFGKEAPVSQRAAVVKERVYGETVEDLIQSRRFTDGDYALVQKMLERMADARVRVWDLRTSNVMIGRTADDPEPRAYMIDGGWLLPVKPAETRESLLRSLRDQRTVVLQLGGGAVSGAGWGGDSSLDPFDDILKEGLRRRK